MLTPIATEALDQLLRQQLIATLQCATVSVACTSALACLQMAWVSSYARTFRPSPSDGPASMGCTGAAALPDPDDAMERAVGDQREGLFV